MLSRCLSKRFGNFKNYTTKERLTLKELEVSFVKIDLTILQKYLIVLVNATHSPYALLHSGKNSWMCLSPALVIQEICPNVLLKKLSCFSIPLR